MYVSMYACMYVLGTWDPCDCVVFKKISRMYRACHFYYWKTAQYFSKIKEEWNIAHSDVEWFNMYMCGCFLRFWENRLNDYSMIFISSVHNNCLGYFDLLCIISNRELIIGSCWEAFPGCPIHSNRMPPKNVFPHNEVTPYTQVSCHNLI